MYLCPSEFSETVSTCEVLGYLQTHAIMLQPGSGVSVTWRVNHQEQVHFESVLTVLRT